MPRSWHPLMDQLGDALLRELLEGLRKSISTCGDAMPTHAQFVARCCAANLDRQPAPVAAVVAR